MGTAAGIHFSLPYSFISICWGSVTFFRLVGGVPYATVRNKFQKLGVRQYNPAKGISRDIGLLSNKQAILTQKNKVSMAFAYLRGTHPSRDVPICWAGIDL